MSGVDVDPKYGTPQQYALRHVWTDAEGVEQEEYFGPWWKNHTVTRSQERRTLNSPPGHRWEVCVLQHTDIIDKGLRDNVAGAWTVKAINGRLVKADVSLRSTHAAGRGKKKASA